MCTQEHLHLAFTVLHRGGFEGRGGLAFGLGEAKGCEHYGRNKGKLSVPYCYFYFVVLLHVLSISYEMVFN